MPFSLIAPAWANAAPINPPSRVCDELEGIPNHQVSRFHVMAAIKPAKITSRVIKFSFTDLAIVLPILNSPIKYFDTKNAAKLKKAAHNTAWKGVRTFVETIVAIEFAAS